MMYFSVNITYKFTYLVMNHYIINILLRVRGVVRRSLKDLKITSVYRSFIVAKPIEWTHQIKRIV